MSMTTVSTKLTLIVFLHVLLLVINGSFVAVQMKRVNNDAFLVNEAGTIRGLIQRVVKLATNGMPYEEAEAQVDEAITRLLEREKSEDLQASLADLLENWNHIKQAIRSAAAPGNGEEERRLLEASERMWRNADGMVLLVQRLSEARQHQLRWVYGILLVDVLLVAGILWIVRNMVRGKLEYEVRHDSLTGAFNRAAYDETLLQQLNVGGGAPLSYLVMDLDDFKVVNDTWGHGAGDAVLREFAHLVRNVIREKDLFCRIGGEEFVLIMPETNLLQARQVAERLRASVETHAFAHIPGMTVSIGLTQARHGDDVSIIHARADELLYEAKRGGKNRVVDG